MSAFELVSEQVASILLCYVFCSLTEIVMDQKDALKLCCSRQRTYETTLRQGEGNGHRSASDSKTLGGNPQGPPHRQGARGCPLSNPPSLAHRAFPFQALHDDSGPQSISEAAGGAVLLRVSLCGEPRQSRGRRMQLSIAVSWGDGELDRRASPCPSAPGLGR